MGRGDKALRTKSIPFRASWFDSSGLGNQFDEAGVAITGDITVIKSGAGNGGSIRIARPAKGDLIAARLTLVAVTPVLSPTTIRLAVGSFDTDGLTAVAPDTNKITLDHKKITGRDAALTYGSQANVLIDGVDFAPCIPKRGETGFSEDGWVMYIELVNRDPTDWHLYTFKVDCQVQLGVL